MKNILTLMILLILVSCGGERKAEVKTEVSNEVDTTTRVVQSNISPDCGMSPYMLLGDQMFSDTTSWYQASIRFVKIVKEREPEVVNIDLINQAVKSMNRDLAQLRIQVEAEEVIVIEDRKAYKEGIQQYTIHGNKYKERGFITVLIYPSTIGGFAGAAGGLISNFFAVKEFYLQEEYNTCSHELLHCLNLMHIHQLDEEGIKNTYYGGDDVCNTPYADFFSVQLNQGYLGRVTDNCTYVGPLGNLTQEEHNANIKNLMSYGVFGCRKEVTSQQIERVHWSINNAADLKECFTLIPKPKNIQ